MRMKSNNRHMFVPSVHFSAYLLFGIVFAIMTVASYSLEKAPVVCPDDDMVCLPEDAACFNGTCLCHSSSGLGQLACHELFEVVCQIRPESVIHTFNGDDFFLPVPCRYLLTEATMISRPDQAPRVCSIKVYSYVERLNGRFQVSGFDAFVKYNTESNTEHELGFRATGVVESEWYNFNLWIMPSQSRGWVKVSSPDWAHLGDDETVEKMEQSEFRIDGVTKRVILKFDYCGLRIFFRPAADDLGRFEEFLLMPGLSVGLDQYYKFEITWDPSSKSLCESPLIEPRNVTGLYSRLIDRDLNAKFLHNALTANVQQFTPATPSCENLMLTVSTECIDVETRSRAMEVCSLILTTPTLVECWSGDEMRTSERIVTLFNMCVQAYCNKRERQCYELIEEIIESGCVKDAYNLLVRFGCKFDIGTKEQDLF